MRKLIVAEQISLDGVIQSPGAPKEDPSGEFRLGGWIVPYADEAIGHALQDLFSQPFELLLGRRTYEIFAAYWPHVRADSASHAIADLFNSVPKHVATHRSDTLDWQNSHALEGDLADAIRALKDRDGVNLLTWGSGDMVRQLLAIGLVDELQLLIYPVVLGRGKRLFGDNAQASAFTLAHSNSTPRGVLIARYVRSGEVRTGTFEEAENDH
jgi:dihydrofolate reductase